MIAMTMPSVLDPHRPVTDRRDSMTSRFEDERDGLRAALDATCAYGRQLWNELEAVRAYLLSSAPGDPNQPGDRRVGATPSGPDDEVGWQNWSAVLASLTQVLAGPAGDSGFGEHEAAREQRDRRMRTENIAASPVTATAQPRRSIAQLLTATGVGYLLRRVTGRRRPR